MVILTIEDKTRQKIKVNTDTVLVLDNKKYEFEYTSPNINNQVAYRYFDDYKEILNSIMFTDIEHLCMLFFGLNLFLGNLKRQLNYLRL